MELVFLMLIVAQSTLVIADQEFCRKNDVQDQCPEVTLSSEATVNTQPCGNIAGKITDEVFSFKGIPYAKPPVGNLRWQKTESLNAKTCWKGTFSATEFGNECSQLDPITNEVQGSEDCLFLTIYTPTLKKNAKLPVLFWIHGGYLMFYNGTARGGSPSPALAKSLNVVFVCINYRVNAFGFIALEVLSRNSPNGKSGNYGFYDQIQALKWVQDNIIKFGGDPNSVTIFGQSSGGTSIFALLGSPLAKGLFQRAWLSSASSVLNKTSADASRDNEVFLQRTGCTDIECLYEKTPEEILKAIPMDIWPYWGMTDLNDIPVKGEFAGAIAIIDGELLPAAPFDTWAKEADWTHKTFPDVPILVGTMAQEAEFLPSQLDMDTWDWSKYEDIVAQKLGTFGQSIKDSASVFYPHEIDPKYSYTTMATDIRVTCPTEVFTNAVAENFISPVFRYVATAAPSVPINAFLEIPFESKYAMHGWDIVSFFGLVDEYIKNPNKNDRLFQALMQDNIKHFALYGTMPEKWSTYFDGTALINTTLQITEKYKAEECNFWLHNGFFSYGWIN